MPLPTGEAVAETMGFSGGGWLQEYVELTMELGCPAAVGGTMDVGRDRGDDSVADVR